MQVSEVLRLIWGKLDRPHSMCPDIEIGYVRRVLGEVMAAEIECVGIEGDEVDRFVLGQALVSQVYESGLADDWYGSKHVYQERPMPPNDNYEDEAYQKAVGDFFEAEDQERAQRSSEVSEAIGRLTKRRLLVAQPSEGRHLKYHGDQLEYQTLIKTGATPV
jgi:hypothetical protein